jgi:hypothetical protein
MSTDENLRAEFEAMRAECARLRDENTRLRDALGLHQLPPAAPPKVEGTSLDGALTNLSSPEAKVKLFRHLFHGREDVYAVRWEGRNGKTGYSPACIRDWRFGRGKNAGKAERKLFPLTDRVIYDHLTGKHIVGVYPLLLDETCWFLAADFDKSSWQQDALAFLATCAE